MTPYTVGTVFSGIGVPDLAARLLGMETVFQIEKDEFCQRVLRKHFPEATLYGDIFDVSNPPYVDIQVYGAPCQPFSRAGAQRGRRDQRYLIPEMIRVIHESRPRVVLFENVPDFATLNDGDAFRELQGAFTEMGYDTEWSHLRASDFGAPTPRERLWLVGYTNSPRRDVANSRTGGSLSVQHGINSTAKCQRNELELGTSLYSPTFRRRHDQSDMGRVFTRTTAWMDGFVGYPARLGEPQFSYEPNRTAPPTAYTEERIRALGNTMAFDVAFALMAAIKSWLVDQDTDGDE